MARLCNVCGKKLSFFASSICKECGTAYKEVERNILATSSITDAQLELLKKHDKESLIKLYSSIYFQWVSTHVTDDKNLDERQIETLVRMQDKLGLTKEEVGFDERVWQCITEAEFSKIEQEILATKNVTGQQLQTLKEYDKESLIELYSEICDRFKDYGELDEQEIATLGKIQVELGLTKEVQMKKLSKIFFLGSYIGATIPLFIVSLVVQVALLKYTYSVETPWWFVLSIILVFPIGIYYTVVLCLFIHNSWALIQDGHARTSACRALGFLFIPFFNLYWIFQAVWGFAVDFNKYAARNNMNAASRLPEGLFLAYCILCVLSFIPYAGWAAIGAYYIIGAVLINKVCDAVNVLPPPNTKLNSGVSRRNC